MKKVILWGLGLCLVLAGGLSTLASSHPDGLEYVAEQLGFGSTATAHGTGDSPLAGYAVRGLGEGPLAGGVAGVIGVLVVAALAFGLMRLLRRRPSARP